MIEKQRQKMIAAINEMRGSQDCTEAVIMTRRPWWTWLVFFAAFLVVFIALRQTDMSPILTGAIGGGLAGGLLAGFADNHLVGYCDGTVVVATSGKFSVKAGELVGEYPRPAPVTVSKGMLLAKVTLEGESYQLAKQLLGRFESITGVAAS